MRGEKLDVTCGARSIWGSPPHARGKEGKKTGKADNAGITPACAGKRPLEGESANATEDHPRMRGEKTETHPLFAVFLRKTPIYTAILCR
mgnify:CR=1 FL=1